MKSLTLADVRPWYSPEDPVHGLDHVQRVYALAERLAQAENADIEIVRAAALLHDARPPSLPGEPGAIPSPDERSDHQLSSAEFARQVLLSLDWSETSIAAVLHCIRAHRFRKNLEPPATLEAKILFDADKLDAMGAIGVARAVAYAVLHQAPFYASPSPGFIAEGLRAPEEPHSAYHEYLFKLRHLKDRLYTQSARQIAQERHQWMASFFERLQSEWLGKC